MLCSHYSWKSKHQAPAYRNDFFVASRASLVSGELLGVLAADMEDIKYLFTSCGDCTERGKGLSAIPASKLGPASALMSKRFVAYLMSFLGVWFYLRTTNLRISKAVNVSYGKNFNA